MKSHLLIEQHRLLEIDEGNLLSQMGRSKSDLSIQWALTINKSVSRTFSSASLMIVLLLNYKTNEDSKTSSSITLKNNFTK